MNDGEVPEDDEDEDVERDGLVPYAPDFTPKTLGNKIGEDNVLEWLLKNARSGPKSALQTLIVDNCLGHVRKPTSRRDMASHVVQGLQNYGLMVVDGKENVSLTKVGADLLKAPRKERYELFARHILTTCNGYRLVETIHRIELSGQTVTMEGLTAELDRSAVSKSLSTMKAWLEKAGVMKRGRTYSVDDARVEELLGRGSTKLLGLSEPEVEFLLAARAQVTMQGDSVLEAADVKSLAEMRRPGVKIPAKALSNFARDLVQQGFIVEEAKARAKGGLRFAFRLSDVGTELTEDQIRRFVHQAGAGMPLERLRPLPEVIEGLGRGSQDERGHYGEMLAVHLCLMLDLRVVAWRKRVAAEIDLTAERTVGLSYQRWHLQVKNVDTQLDTDRVDREVGAAAGTGATHLLFVVPRASVNSAARVEINAKCRLTHLHIYDLSAASLASPIRVASLVRDLRAQEAKLTRIKRQEAERRELVG